MAGRPEREFDQATADRICDLLAGGIPLTAIPEHKGMPSDKVIRKWRRTNLDFDRAIAHAREQAADALAEECIAIADRERDPQKAKNRIQVRQWLASKWKPNLYSERLQLEGRAVLDISQALKDAVERRPMRDLPNVIDGQVVEKEQEMLPCPRDKQSKECALEGEIDIFS